MTPKPDIKVGNAILRHQPTGGLYKILPVEEC